MADINQTPVEHRVVLAFDEGDKFADAIDPIVVDGQNLVLPQIHSGYMPGNFLRTFYWDLEVTSAIYNALADDADAREACAKIYADLTPGRPITTTLGVGWTYARSGTLRGASTERANGKARMASTAMAECSHVRDFGILPGVWSDGTLAPVYNPSTQKPSAAKGTYPSTFSGSVTAGDTDSRFGSDHQPLLLEQYATFALCPNNAWRRNGAIADVTTGGVGVAGPDTTSTPSDTTAQLSRISDTYFTAALNYLDAFLDRYPHITHVNFWNEPSSKDYWDGGTNNYNLTKYLEHLNAVEAKLVATHDTVHLGAPYVVFNLRDPGHANASTDVFGDGWALDDRDWEFFKSVLAGRGTLSNPGGGAANRNNYQFITYDYRTFISESTGDTDAIDRQEVHAKINAAIRALNPATYKGCTTYPIVVTEAYFYPTSRGDSYTNDEALAAMISHLLSATKCDTSRLFFWDPMTGSEQWPIAAFTNTGSSGGGTDTVLTYWLEQFKDLVPPGTTAYQSPCRNENITALFTDTHLFAVNRSASPQEIKYFNPVTGEVLNLAFEAHEPMLITL